MAMSIYPLVELWWLRVVLTSFLCLVGGGCARVVLGAWGLGLFGASSAEWQGVCRNVGLVIVTSWRCVRCGTVNHALRTIAKQAEGPRRNLGVREATWESSRPAADYCSFPARMYVLESFGGRRTRLRAAFDRFSRRKRPCGAADLAAEARLAEKQASSRVATLSQAEITPAGRNN